MKSRDELKDEIKYKMSLVPLVDLTLPIDFDEVRSRYALMMADFILEDRKRVLEPLARLQKAQVWAEAWKYVGEKILREEGII